MLLFNTSLREQNNSARVIQEVAAYFDESGRRFECAAMEALPLFTGQYIDEVEETNERVARLLTLLIDEPDHLYLVPTYYKMMPGAFKNFLDITRIGAVYHGKRIGIVATNAKNQDYGARQFLQTLLGLLEFHRAVSVVVPQILILDPDGIDRDELGQYLDYFEAFPRPTIANDSPTIPPGR